MKYLIIIIALCVSGSLAAQTQKTKTEILDQEVRKAKRLFNQDYQEITFTLFELTDMDENKSQIKLSVSLENAQTEVLYRTIGINTGIIGTSAGAATKQNVNNSTIELSIEDLDKIKTFINETLRFKNEGSKNPVSYALAFSERFTIGFGKQKSSNWKYFVKVDDNVFEIEYTEGVGMLRRLMDFRQRMVRA